MTIEREAVIRLALEAAGEPEQSGWGAVYTFEPVELERFASLILEHGCKPLTDEQIMDICSSGWLSHPIEVARGIEEAHGITNKESSDVKPS